MRIFEFEDVVLLLRSKIERAGSQSAWAKKTGVNRTTLNMVLHGRPPTKAILRALKLRVVFAEERAARQ